MWQHLFALRRLRAGVLPAGLLFSECDFPEDYAHVTGELYPAILARDADPRQEFRADLSIQETVIDRSSA